MSEPATPISGTHGKTHPERDDPARTPAHDVLFATVWLVFLAFPVTAVLTATGTPTGLKVLALAGIAGFSLLYVLSWWRLVLLSGQSMLVNCVVWCVLLALPLMSLVPISPWLLTYVSPFFVAVCVFRLPWRPAVLAAAVFFGFVLLCLPLRPEGTSAMWTLLGIAPAWLLILVSRFVMERSEQHERLQHQLHLATQREAVGRDVHDILGHSLTVITVKTQLAQRLLDTDPQRARAELDDVLALARESLTDVRATVGRLREPELSVQLAQARSALRSAGITPRLPSTVPSLAPTHRAAFAWILREAVTNVVRHSGASTCTVTLTADTLNITDDGAGPAHARDGAHAASSADSAHGGGAGTAGLPEGSGLRGMRERAHAAGLSFALHSPVTAHGGTRVTVTAEPALTPRTEP